MQAVNLDNRIHYVDLPEYRLIQELNITPRIESVEDVEFTIQSFEDALNKDRKIGDRIASFISGQSKISRGIGSILDFVTLFVPFGRKIHTGREAIRLILERKQRQMPERIVPFLKQKSTWEGIAIGAASIGLFVSPEGAAMIVGGLGSIYAGVKLWQKESKVK